MIKPWLVQRLQRPHKDPAFINPFNFGGGMVNGGFSKEGLLALQQLFTFDYMGAAEFEFGDVPKAFATLQKEVKTFKRFQIQFNKVSVFVICRIVDETEVVKWLRKHAEGSRDTRLKCYSSFPEAVGLDPYDKQDEYTPIGWVELKNPFFFFVDKKTFTEFADGFGVKE